MHVVALKKRTYAIIAVIIIVVVVCLVASIVNFSSGELGPGHGGSSFNWIGNLGFAPYIYNTAKVDISMGYTPPAQTIVLYCFYTVKDSNLKTIDSSIMLHFPFASQYVILKTLTNLPNDNYTMTINTIYADGTVHTPLNSTFTVDTTFQPPKLALISPQNQNYNTTDIDVTFNVDSNLIWAYYRLDSSGQDDWTRCYGNMTLHGLSEGTHTLTISVKTEANQHTRNANLVQTVCFNITK